MKFSFLLANNYKNDRNTRRYEGFFMNIATPYLPSTAFIDITS